MHERIVRVTTLEGFFMLPPGITLYRQDATEPFGSIHISTVCLDNGHLESPVRIAAEHGYETIIFLENCSLFSLYTAQYKTHSEAEAGHAEIIKQLVSGKLKLAIPITEYHVDRIKENE